MTTSMGSTALVAAAQRRERSSVEARARFENGVVFGEDEARAAALGRLHELPSLGEVFTAWLEQISADQCEDYAVDFRDVLLAPDGRIDMGDPNEALATKHGTNPFGPPLSATGTKTPGRLQMTYRTFGNLLRHYCSPERNVARNFVRLPRAQDPAAHSGRTMRYTAGEGELFIPMQVDSPRAIAYNALLDERKRADQRVTSITEETEPRTTVIFRTRVLNRLDKDGKLVSSPRVAYGVVTPTHSLRDGDDDKLVAALTLAFAGSVNSARGAAYRGVEESELRVVFPALEVSVPETSDGTPGASVWSGYITARNSESGAKSWSISAGLYRQTDGAAVACEALIRTGRHVGAHVAERMVEVAEGAAELLKTLVEKAGELAGRVWPESEESLLRHLRAALAGTAMHDADACCGLAFDLGWAVTPHDFMRGVDPVRPAITMGTLINVVGRAAAASSRRVDQRPVEVMLGRMLVNGWNEFRAAGTETTEDGEE